MKDELKSVARSLSRKLKISMAEAETAYALVHHVTCDSPSCSMNAWAEVVALHCMQEMVTELLPSTAFAQQSRNEPLAFKRAGLEARLVVVARRHAPLLGAMRVLGGEGTVQTFLSFITQTALDGSTIVEFADLN